MDRQPPAREHDTPGAREFLARCRREYGLVPQKGESLRAFRKRVRCTVTNPKGHAPFFLSSGVRTTTARVQRITEKYLGIRSEPITAYSGEAFWFSKHLLGTAIPEADGSAVVGTQAFADNTEAIIADLARHIKGIIDVAPVEAGPWGGRADVYAAAGLRGDDPLDRAYCAMYDGLMKNETLLMLHEGIHAIHLNNSRYGRARGDAGLMLGCLFGLYTLPLRLLPVFRPILRLRVFAFNVETEALAYKVSLDELTGDYVRQAAAAVGDEECVDWFCGQFRERNSRMAVATIRRLYVQRWWSGYGTAWGNYAAAIAFGYGAMTAFARPGPAFKAAGILSLALAASSLLRAPLAAYFDRRARRVVEMIDELSDRFGGAARAFYQILGFEYKDWSTVLATDEPPAAQANPPVPLIV